MQIETNSLGNSAPGVPRYQWLLMTVVLVCGAWGFMYSMIAARERGRTASCQSDLKQLALGFHQYVFDYDDHFPIYNVRNVGVEISASRRQDAWVKALVYYTRNINNFTCPKDENNIGTDFYLNIAASGASKKVFRYSAFSVLTTEGVDITPCSLATASAPITIGEPPIWTRHQGGSNYMFVDGHVKWLASADAPGTGPAAAGSFTFGS